MARQGGFWALAGAIGMLLAVLVTAGSNVTDSTSLGASFIGNDGSSLGTLISSVLPDAVSSEEGRAANKAALEAQSDFVNDLVAGSLLPKSWYDALPRYGKSYVRNLIGVIAIYFGLGIVWSYYIYFCFGEWLFKPHEIPNMKDVMDQAKIASLSMPLYAILPVVTEWAVEEGYTLVYANVSDVGVPAYIGLFVAYMACVEYGVYWMHRGLHELRLGYQLLHHTHHKYNKEHSMTPFAGLAFNALDGMMQAWPYCAALALVPMHYTTHLLLLFATGVWTCNIHDNIHGNVAPIMGAKYHTIHHTTYKHNYGHYFIFMDYLHGTLETPEEHYERLSGGKPTAKAS